MFYTVCQILLPIAFWNLFETNQDFGHTFPRAEFTKDDIVPGLIDRNSRTGSFEEGGFDVGSQGSSNNKICIS